MICTVSARAPFVPLSWEGKMGRGVIYEPAVVSLRVYGIADAMVTFTSTIPRSEGTT